MTPLYNVCYSAAVMLAHSLVFNPSREPDVGAFSLPLTVFLTVRIALERRPGKLLAHGVVQLLSEAGGL